MRSRLITLLTAMMFFAACGMAAALAPAGHDCAGPDHERGALLLHHRGSGQLVADAEAVAVVHRRLH